MKMKDIIVISLLTAILMVTGCSSKINELSELEESEGWELLFNGENLNNWKAYNADGTGTWMIEDGLLAASGEGSDRTGYIITRNQYENFDLKFEWKIAPEGNSGVMYQVIESERYPTPYLTGPEYQLVDDVGYPSELEEWQKTGADYAMYPPDKSKKDLKPVGEWNSSRIIFDNGHVEHWLNGEKILEFEAWTDEWFEHKNSGKWGNTPGYGLSSLGHISLQDHGSKIWFRNMKIKELPEKKSEPVELFNGVNLDGWIEYGNELWYVEDSLLVCESGPEEQYGYLATEMFYKDFDLSVDFKQVSDGNSGIFFRSVFDGTKVTGWQVEVAPKGHDSGGIYESYGRGWLKQIPDENEDILKEGEWNTMRVKVVGSEVTTWLNGEEMTHLDDSRIGEANGRIALQIHDGGGIKVLWKNLVLKPL
ncbi:MAG: 3-keto-disaccharide hydrolase [Bacteroidota bacterium]